MSTLRTAAVTICTLHALLLGCGDTLPVESVAPDSTQAILAGGDDTADTAVVAVLLTEGVGEMCTGFLLMPDVVVTGRHCAAALINPGGGCFGDGATTAPEAAPASALLVDGHPAPSFFGALHVDAVTLVGEPQVCGNDIALLQLSAPLEGVTPLVPRLNGPPVVDEPLRVVGYGASAGGPDTTSGVRRARADVAVEAVGESARTVEGEWIITEGSCAGDSGSPALSAAGEVVGVMSRGDRSTCTHMIYQRVDVHADALREAARASAERLGIDVPAWAALPVVDAGPQDDGASDDDVPAGCSAAGLRGTAGLWMLAALLLRRRRAR